MSAREKIALDMGDMMLRIRELEAQLDAVTAERDWLKIGATATENGASPEVKISPAAPENLGGLT